MDGVGSALTGQVRARVDANVELDVEPGLLVLAALEGDEALDRALSGDAGDPDALSTADTDVGDVSASRAYLDTISVQGFRGIGAACDLRITPGAGLTLVVGRNGSGKSSFAEALELLLTGQNRRWEDRSAVWKGGWRNLHWPGPVAIAAAVEGRRQPLAVRREWAADADLTAGVDSVDGVQGGDARAALGWDEAIATHRPFLPYNELGSIPDYKPAELYDLMSAAFGSRRAGRRAPTPTRSETRSGQAGQRCRILSERLVFPD